jgi:hypothetical protein
MELSDLFLVIAMVVVFAALVLSDRPDIERRRKVEAEKPAAGSPEPPLQQNGMELSALQTDPAARILPG